MLQIYSNFITVKNNYNKTKKCPFSDMKNQVLRIETTVGLHMKRDIREI